jgi:ABC-type phosphate transport system substrate-binding protein
VTRVGSILVAGALVALSLAGAVVHAQAETKVEPIVAVINAANDAGKISKADLKNIYLGRQKTWSGGGTIRPYMRPTGAGAGFALLRNVLKMTPARFRHYWQELELSGQGTAPKSITTAKDVIDKVGAEEGAISYLTETEAKNAGDKVKILKIPD